MRRQHYNISPRTRYLVLSRNPARARTKPIARRKGLSRLYEGDVHLKILTAEQKSAHRLGVLSNPLT
jgi:hypothetical protein